MQHETNSYESYFNSRGTMFPYVRNRDEDIEVKEWVVGVELNGAHKAYPVEELPANEWTRDQIGDTKVRFRYSPEADSFKIETADGKTLPAVHAFWFAWQAFYPETELWQKR